jgi:hypothetical protein
LNQGEWLFYLKSWIWCCRFELFSIAVGMHSKKWIGFMWEQSLSHPWVTPSGSFLGFFLDKRFLRCPAINAMLLQKWLRKPIKKSIRGWEISFTHPIWNLLKVE